MSKRYDKMKTEPKIYIGNWCRICVTRNRTDSPPGSGGAINLMNPDHVLPAHEGKADQ